MAFFFLEYRYAKSYWHVYRKVSSTKSDDSKKQLKKKKHSHLWAVLLVTFPATSKTQHLKWHVFFLDCTGVHNKNAAHEVCVACHLDTKLYCLATKLPQSKFYSKSGQQHSYRFPRFHHGRFATIRHHFSEVACELVVIHPYLKSWY